MTLKIVGPYPGYHGGELYQARFNQEYAGEIWIKEGRIKLLDAWGEYRHKGIATALLDVVLQKDPDLV